MKAFLFSVGLVALVFAAAGSAAAQCNQNNTKVLINNVAGSASTPTPAAGKHVFLTQMVLSNGTSQPEIDVTAHVAQVLDGTTPITLVFDFSSPAGTQTGYLYPYSDIMEGPLGAAINVSITGTSSSLVLISVEGCIS